MKQYMETASCGGDVMTESVVVTSDVEDTVRKVLPQFVQEGDEQDQMSGLRDFLKSFLILSWGIQFF